MTNEKYYKNFEGERYFEFEVNSGGIEKDHILIWEGFIFDIYNSKYNNDLINSFIYRLLMDAQIYDNECFDINPKQEFDAINNRKSFELNESCEVVQLLKNTFKESYFAHKTIKIKTSM